MKITKNDLRIGMISHQLEGEYTEPTTTIGKWFEQGYFSLTSAIGNENYPAYYITWYHNFIGQNKTVLEEINYPFFNDCFIDSKGEEILFSVKYKIPENLIKKFLKQDFKGPVALTFEVNNIEGNFKPWSSVTVKHNDDIERLHKMKGVKFVE